MKIMKINTKILTFIILISIYHYFIHNGLEKMFSQAYFDYNSVKRPLLNCSSENNSPKLSCIGMPSGHAETASVFSFLLYFYKIIPLWLCLLIISVISLQRITSKMHTLNQVAMGSILGLLYALIYKNLTYGFGIVFTIGILIVLLTIHKIDQQVYGPVPDWVNQNMYDSIKKKQNTPIYYKISTIYTNSIVQGRTFLTWNQLEKSLDKIVEKINKSGTKFDAVVGIKTGGAIISDYISLKLGLTNYKIKLSREEYKCNKKPINVINDILKKRFAYNDENYILCEGIDDNLEGKNIILVDELVATGKTMEEAYNYLKEEKNAYIVKPVCISFFKSLFNNNNYLGKLDIDNVLNGTVLIWPWGYDN